MSEQSRDQRKTNFRHHAVKALEQALSNKRFKYFDNELGLSRSLLKGAKEFDPKLATKIEAVNAAHREMDAHILEQFKEANGDGTANG